MIVLQYALDYPDALSHLVVADAPAGIPEAFQPQQQQELQLINTVSVSETAHRRMGKEFATRNQHLRQWLIVMIELMDAESYRSQANASFAFNIWNRLHEITAPTTLIWRALDAIIPVPMGIAMQQALPGSTLRIVEGCGHFVNLEAPEAFHALLAEVLGLPLSASGAATSIPHPA
jgi:pimeloyl-ACP methyl ester carboxylesterase